MNICVFTHTYPRFAGDPVAPFMKDFCHGLAEQGENVILLAPFDRLFSIKENTTKNIKVKLYRYAILSNLHTLGYSRTLIGDQRFKLSVFFLAPFMLLSSFFSLFSTVNKEKIQIISAHWIIPNGFIAAIISKITGVPLVITVPGSDAYLGKKNFLFRWMVKFAASQAKVLVSNSMRYLDELSELGIDTTKFVEIPYGVNINSFTNIYKKKNHMRKLMQFSESEKIILAVGRLVEKKGFAYLINAISLVAKEQKNVKLLIIGDGTEKNALQQQVLELNIQNNVIFLGIINHTDLPKYYAVADLYVAPSIKDKYGNLESHIVALFEAIASGLPIVATKLAVSEKYVVDGKNGYRVNDKNIDDLAMAIIRMLNSKKLSEMAKYSSDIAKKYLSYQFCTKEYIKIFKSLQLRS